MMFVVQVCVLLWGGEATRSDYIRVLTFMDIPNVPNQLWREPKITFFCYSIVLHLFVSLPQLASHLGIFLHSNSFSHVFSHKKKRLKTRFRYMILLHDSRG